MAERINVSLPKNDLTFCKSRDLSPSKLLQERITQIRDEQIPRFQKALADVQKSNTNLRGKLQHSAKMLEKIGSVINEKFGEEAFNEIWEKI